MDGYAYISSLLGLDARFRRGQVALKHGSLVSIVAAATTTTLYQVSADRDAEAWLVALLVYNDNASNSLFTVRNSAGTVVLPTLYFISGFHDLVLIPPRQFTTDITAQSDVGGADPSDIEVMAWVLEIF